MGPGGRRREAATPSIAGVSEAPGDDWRRTGQEDYLKGARLTWKRFQAYSGNWEHEHCVFCWKKFLDANYASWMREALESGSEEHAGHGYTTKRQGDLPAGGYWICRPCFDDFASEFEWTVEDSDPEAWPYDPPEPKPRPRAADFDPERGSQGP